MPVFNIVITLELKEGAWTVPESPMAFHVVSGNFPDAGGLDEIHVVNEPGASWLPDHDPEVSP